MRPASAECGQMARATGWVGHCCNKHGQSLPLSGSTQKGLVTLTRMEKCEVLVSGPELAIDSRPWDAEIKEEVGETLLVS